MEKSRYSLGAILLHWAIAIAVIANWRIVEGAESALTREEAGLIMDQHKALGMIILALTLARLAWRLAHRPPPLAATLKAWERRLARTVHILFYVLLIALPLGGWVGNSMYGQPLDVFGIVTLPALPVTQDTELAGSIFDFHANMGKALLGLIGLHILGALKHHFVDRNGALFRMLPFGSPKA